MNHDDSYIRLPAGVGDDAYGWACDGISVSRWHGGSNLSWGQSWPAKGAQGAEIGLESM